MSVSNAANIPSISNEAARLGISIIGNAMTQFKMDDVRVLDIRRGVAYGMIDVPLKGDERQLFLTHYKRALDDWQKIKKELE